MPYIKQENRSEYDVIINQLQRALSDLQGKPMGDCNYVISRIVWKLFNECPNYENGNVLYGMLHTVAAEFYRRKLAPYEDLKIKENGDLPEGE